MQALLEEYLCNPRRTKRVAACGAIGSNEWTDEIMAAWDVVRLRVRGHASESIKARVLCDGVR